MVDDAAIEKAATSFAAARNKLKLPGFVDKSAKATKARQAARSQDMDQRHLRRTGRTELWGLRCRPGLKEECQAIAKARGIPVAEWAESIFEAAIAAHNRGNGK
jgi:type II secretory pathway pseudopilin PulG